MTHSSRKFSTYSPCPSNKKTTVEDGPQAIMTIEGEIIMAPKIQNFLTCSKIVYQPYFCPSTNRRSKLQYNYKKQDKRIGGMNSLCFSLIHCEYIYTKANLTFLIDYNSKCKVDICYNNNLFSHILLISGLTKGKMNGLVRGKMVFTTIEQPLMSFL